MVSAQLLLYLSQKALSHMDEAKLPRTYFDFRDMLKANANGGFPYTPPLNLIYGLRESLKMLFEEGLDSNELTDHAFKKYSISFGIGLADMNGKAFRIGHLGSLTEVIVLAGLATIEMAMVDLDYSIKLGQGVAAAQEYYRNN